MQGNRRATGFTLIEILVVMVVVGLLAAIAVVNLGGGQERRQLENSVRELYLLMQTASEQAVVNNQELGLMLTDTGYRFVIYSDKDDDWVAQGERLFSPRTWPDWLVATPIIDNDLPRLASQEDVARPDIVFFSSGEITPFELEFTIKGRDSQPLKIEAGGFDGLDMTLPGDNADEAGS